MMAAEWSGKVAPFDTPFGHSGCLVAAAWTGSLRCQDGTPLDCSEVRLRYAASLCSLATWDANGGADLAACCNTTACPVVEGYIEACGQPR
jgi:hypothetical protein